MMPDWIGDRTVYPRWIGAITYVQGLLRPITLLLTQYKQILSIDNNPIILYLRRK